MSIHGDTWPHSQIPSRCCFCLLLFVDKTVFPVECALLPVFCCFIGNAYLRKSFPRLSYILRARPLDWVPVGGTQGDGMGVEKCGKHFKQYDENKSTHCEQPVFALSPSTIFAQTLPKLPNWRESAAGYCQDFEMARCDGCFVQKPDCKGCNSKLLDVDLAGSVPRGMSGMTRTWGGMNLCEPIVVESLILKVVSIRECRLYAMQSLVVLKFPWESFRRVIVGLERVRCVPGLKVRSECRGPMCNRLSFRLGIFDHVGLQPPGRNKPWRRPKKLRCSGRWYLETFHVTSSIPFCWAWTCAFLMTSPTYVDCQKWRGQHA